MKFTKKQQSTTENEASMDNPVALPTKEVAEVVKAEPIKEEHKVLYNETALSVFKDPLTGYWAVAQIRFNTLTGDVSKVETILADDGSRNLAIERYKILAARQFIL